VVALQQDLIAPAHAHELMPKLGEASVAIGTHEGDGESSD
jgi:hypothetical protein